MTCKLCGSGRPSRLLRSQDSDIIRCPDCGFAWREPYRPCSGSRCAECADRCIDHLDDAGFLQARLRVDGRRAEGISRLAGDLSPARVLELGAGLGCLAARLSGSAGEYRGLEASPLFMKHLRKNFPELSAKVSEGSLPGPGEKGRWDLLVMVDVLQFAPEPEAFLGTAAESLAPGGRVYIEVPDESLMAARAAVRGMLGLYRGSPLHHGHINFFTPGALRLMLKKTGLKPLKLRQASIAADEDRLFLTLKRPLPAWLRLLSMGARCTGADTLLGLGNTVCLCGRQDEP